MLIFILTIFQDSWSPVYSVVTNSQKFKWLRQRLTGSTADTALMSKITEFILYEHPIDIEKLRKSLHHQVQRAEIRLKGIQNILSLVHKDHIIPTTKYAILCGWQGLIAGSRTIG